MTSADEGHKQLAVANPPAADGIGLALSGGGFRATLFHLGVLRYMHERALLPRLSYITSVSGGSIIAAHLILHWPRYQTSDGFEAMAKEIVRLAQVDVRGQIVRRLPTHFVAPFFTRQALLQRKPRFKHGTTTRTLLFERRLERLYDKAHLKDLSGNGRPRLRILATNLTTGTAAYFSAAGFVPAPNHDTLEIPLRLAVAVATSAAAPQLFPPKRFDSDYLGLQQRQFPNPAYLTDGGVYDNLGLRPFLAKGSQIAGRCTQIILSDASGAFDWAVGREFTGLLGTALRAAEVLTRRITDQQYAVIEGDKRFLKVCISDEVRQPIAPEGYPLNMGSALRNIRTDLNRFTNLEVWALAQHGYLVAEQTLRGLADEAPRPGQTDAWTPPVTKPRTALQDMPAKLVGSRRKAWGLLALRDGVSWLHVLVLAVGCYWGWTQISSRHERSSLLTDYQNAEQTELGLLECGASTDELFDRATSVAPRWPRNRAVQLTAAEIARSALECGIEQLTEDGKTFSIDLLPERARLLAEALDRLQRALPAAKETPVTSRYHWLRGHQAYRLGESERKKGTSRGSLNALRHYTRAARDYEASGLRLYEELQRVEFRIGNVARVAYKADPSNDSAQAHEWLRRARHHTQRANELARYRDDTHWPATFVLGAIDFDEGQYWAQGEERTHLYQDATETLAEALREATDKGDGDYLKDHLRHWLGRKSHAELCPIAAFAATFNEFCRAPVATFDIEGSDLRWVFRHTSSGENLTWEWDLDGDGVADASSREVAHVYTETGVYKVRLTVSNDFGEDSADREVKAILPSDVPRPSNRNDASG